MEKNKKLILFSNFADRLLKSIGNRSVKDISDESGIAVSTIRSYINGTEPKISAFVVLARSLKVDLQWLATGEGYDFDSENHGKSSERIIIPYLKLDMFSDNQVNWHLIKSSMVIQTRLSINWIKEEIGVVPPNGMRWCYVESDAMGSEISKGTLVLISLCSSDDKCPEGIHAVRMGGGIVFRRLQPDPLSRYLTLVPGNPVYKETSVPATKVEFGEILKEDKVVVVGKVVFICHRI